MNGFAEFRFFPKLWRLDFVDVCDMDDNTLTWVFYIGPFVAAWHFYQD